jgi:hypothetical protein
MLSRAASLASPAKEQSASRQRQELGQAQLRQHRRGLVRRLQRGLQCQNLARHLIGRYGLGLVDDVLQHGLGLGLPGGGVFHGGLRGGKVRLNILDGLLSRLRRQVLRDALVQCRDLGGRIRTGRRDGGEHRDRLQLGANGLLIGARAVLNGDRLIDPRDRRRPR